MYSYANVCSQVLRVVEEGWQSGLNTVGRRERIDTDIYKDIYDSCGNNKLLAVTVMLLVCIRQATSSNPDNETVDLLLSRFIMASFDREWHP
jgi:hypothetical protein